MSLIYIRIAEDYDNEQVNKLSARCPQDGMITLFVNRTPRFNTLHRLLDPEAWHFVACTEKELIGLIGVVHFQGKVLERTCKIGYMLDLRLDTAYRSGTTAYRMVKAAVDRIYQTDADLVIASFIRDNNRSLVFTSGRGRLPKPLYLGSNRIFNLLPILPMKLSNRFEIENPTEKDIPEIAEIYRKYAKGFKISPVITTERFTNILQSIDGLSPDHFFVARENGKIKAISAIWDEHTYKTYQVLKLNFSMRTANFILKFLANFMRVPHPIRLNEPLRQLWLVLYAHDDCPEALEAVFRYLNNINLGSDCTMITINAQEKDPVFNLLKKFTGVSINSEMYLFAKDTALFEQLNANPLPVLQDITMLL